MGGKIWNYKKYLRREILFLEDEMTLREYCKKNKLDITWKRSLLEVLKRQHKKSKIHSITCNINTVWLISEWCDKYKVKKIFHNNEMEDYEIMITYEDYNKKSSYWIMDFATYGDIYFVGLQLHSEKNKHLYVLRD